MQARRHSPRLRSTSPLSSQHSFRTVQPLATPFSRLVSRQNINFNTLPQFLRGGHARPQSHSQQFTDFLVLDQSFHILKKPRQLEAELAGRKPMTIRTFDACLALFKEGQTDNNESIFVASARFSLGVFNSERSALPSRLNVAKYQYLLGSVLAFPVYTGHWQLIQARVNDGVFQIHQPADGQSELIDVLVNYLRTEVYFEGQTSPDWSSFRRDCFEFSECDSALHVLQLLHLLVGGRPLTPVVTYRQELLEKVSHLV